MADVVIIYPREKRIPLEINSFRSRMPRYGVLAIASYLEANGHSARVFCELTGSKIDWDAVRDADYVCFSFLSFCAARAYEMADRVRAEFGKVVIMGGSHCSVMPEDALAHADFVVRNEGEETLRELIQVLQSGGDAASVDGISFADKNGKPVHNKDRQFLDDLSVPINLDLLPEYRSMGLWWSFCDALSNGAPRVPMPVVQASRGCTENCRFCVVKHQLGNKYRKRNLDIVLREIDDYLERFKNPYIFFTDNDLSVDPDFTRALFTTILDRYGTGLRPYVYSRVSIYKNPELLSLLEKFDQTTIGIGFESLCDTALRDLGKRQKLVDIQEAVEKLKYYGLKTHGLFIVGGEDDTAQSIRDTVDFCIKNKFFNIALTPIYDFPARQAILGQPQMVPDHLFIHRDWRFYSGNFAVHFPRHMRPSELQEEILRGYHTFFRQSKQSMVPFMPIRPTMLSYIKYLREIESEFYNTGGKRIEIKLENRKLRDIPAHAPVNVPAWAIYHESFRFISRNIFRGASWHILSGSIFPGPRAPSQDIVSGKTR